MQLYPTRTAAHLAIAGATVVAVGLVGRMPAVVAYGGAIVLAIALARAATLVSVARIRAAGFEMLWKNARRVVRTARGGTVELDAEVRNRDTLAARYVGLRTVASPRLSIELDPRSGEVAASGRLGAKVRVHARRVGRHGIHGLSLEVLGAPGLFEVPLTFANPLGVEVLPRALAGYLLDPRGGRSRMTGVGRAGRRRGEGTDLRELREHQPGDPFRRIAWKASARRGVLLVREFEREERDTIWILLDASVELWGGPVGRAPLDFAIDEVASVAVRHLGRGDRVGLCVVGGTVRAALAPDAGPAHGHRLAQTLLDATATYDADRSDLDESDVVARVLEHLRPLDPRGLADLRPGDIDELAARAEAARARAPFSPPVPAGRSLRERTLRRYLAAYGIDSPPRAEPEPGGSASAMLEALGRIGQHKPRATLVHVVAPPPDEVSVARIGEAARRLVRRGVGVTWSPPPFEPALSAPFEPPGDGRGREPAPKPPAGWEEVVEVASEAVILRARATRARQEALLRRQGIRLLHPRPAAAGRPAAALLPAEPV